MPPNTTGLISESDVKRLKQLRTALDTIFTSNLAQNLFVQASSQRGPKNGVFGPNNVLDDDHLWTYWAPSEKETRNQWIEFRAKDGEGKIVFNVVRIQEAIGLGQRVKKHEVYADGVKVAKGSTIGYKRLHRLRKGVVNATCVRIKIVRARGGMPLISSLGLHFDPFWKPKGGREA